MARVRTTASRFRLVFTPVSRRGHLRMMRIKARVLEPGGGGKCLHSSKLKHAVQRGRERESERASWTARERERKEEEEEEEEVVVEEEHLFKADAVNEEDPERDHTAQEEEGRRENSRGLVMDVFRTTITNLWSCHILFFLPFAPPLSCSRSCFLVGRMR